MRAPIDRPNLLWRAFVIGGFSTMKALSFSDGAWSWWEAHVTDAIPRSAVRRTLAVATTVHLAEAVVAHRQVRRRGLEHGASWTFTTLLYGFPELGRIRRAARSG